MEGIAVCRWSTRWLCQHSFWTFLATGSLSRRVPVVFNLTLYPTPSHRIIMPESLNHLNLWEVRIQAGTWRIQHPLGKQKDSRLWVTLFDALMTEKGILINPWLWCKQYSTYTMITFVRLRSVMLLFCVCWLILERLTCARILILLVVGMLCGWSDCYS